VREHRFNQGRRATAFYKYLQALPGVDLIDPVDDQYKYIRHAALIVTDNGTTGFEGLMLGKRVISLGDDYYSATGLTLRLSDPSQLGAAMMRRLAEPEVRDSGDAEHRLGWLVDAEYDTTLAEGDESLAAGLDCLCALLGRS